jgi:uncharacterized protein
MRTLKITLIVLAIFSCAVAAQEQLRTVTVSGEATEMVVPDQVEWKLKINVRSEVQEDLTVQAGAIIKQLKSVASRLGLDVDDITFGRVILSIRYKKENKSRTDRVSHYELIQPITVTQTDIDLYDKYWKELTAIEGLQVNQNFVSTAIEKTKKQLRIKALQAAKQKAEDLAAVVGAKVGDALSISEFRSNPVRSYAENASMRMDSSPSSVGNPEGINVTAKIYAEFVLE